MDKITAIYCRTSTAKQEKGMESQLRALQEYCTHKGIKNTRIFEDEGFSGAKAKRPALDQLLKLVDSGEVGTVLVYSFSRMARSTKHLLEVLEVFRQKNVRFTSITEHIETDSPMGQMLFTLVAAFAQLERSLIVERIECGLKNAKAKGKKLGRPSIRPSILIQELASKGYTQKRIAELANTSRASVWREMTTNNKPFHWSD